MWASQKKLQILYRSSSNFPGPFDDVSDSSDEDEFPGTRKKRKITGMPSSGISGSDRRRTTSSEKPRINPGLVHPLMMQRASEPGAPILPGEDSLPPFNDPSSSLRPGSGSDRRRTTSKEKPRINPGLVHPLMMQRASEPGAPILPGAESQLSSDDDKHSNRQKFRRNLRPMPVPETPSPTRKQPPKPGVRIPETPPSPAAAATSDASSLSDLAAAVRALAEMDEDSARARPAGR